ncbi:Phosphotransferase system mannitol/fructose-specific IIA domain (Ntr-type) [Variovorax sp. HW608]|nr:Phosphotransferase system mannitol/fructose-specific IIA domain (Ntr-type) [Variovorax sp. HW608]
MLKVLVPVDSSERALNAVRHAAHMFKGHRVSQVVLLNVQAPLEAGHACAYHSWDELRKLEEKRGEAVLLPARQILDSAGASYVTQVRLGEVMPTISEVVAANDCNAIVMGTAGRTAIGELISTRLANKLVRHCHVPVIVVSSDPSRGVVVHGETPRIDQNQNLAGRRGSAGADGRLKGDVARIAAWLQPRDILFDVDVRDRAHALELAAAAICSGAQGLDPLPVSRALWRREQTGSTALGEGLAIPHARIGGITRPTTLLMRTRRPVPFDAPDGKPVSQLLVIVVPEGGAQEDHLQMLALVAQLFSDRDFRAQLDGAPDATAAADVFRAAIAGLIPQRDFR